MNVTNYIARVKKININKAVVLLSLSFIVACFSILHVILGYAKTPPGTTYMWTGHYYLDLFYYVVFIAQGQHGHWVAFQQFATDDPSRYYHWFPYILIGQVFRFFSISPFIVYWIAVFLLSFVVSFLILVVITKLIEEQAFPFQIAAFLLTLFATPFFFISSGEIQYYDYWFSYSSFFRRFEPIPHHLLGIIVILVSLLFLSRYLKLFKNRSFFNTLKNSFVITGLIVLLLGFYPFQAVVLLGGMALSVTYYGACFMRRRDWMSVTKLLTFIFIIGAISFSAGLFFKSLYSETFTAGFKETESRFHYLLSLKEIILTTGPLILLLPLGFFSYSKEMKPIRLVFLAFLLSSYLLFYSPADAIIGTHNRRFISPLQYVLVGAIGLLGIVYLAKRFSLSAKKTVLIITVGFILYFIPVNYQAFRVLLTDKNLNSPITYLPSGIIDAMKFVRSRQDSGNVLMTPSQFLGTIIPVYTDRKTYVARHIATPNYLEKNIKASNFYLGAMSKNEAKSFLTENNIRFVILTTIEGYDVHVLFTYPFLERVYKNNDAVVFEVR
ncbi:hypothetical protein A2866_03470 [Candidatus Roizmanbacteria bacterium RIFCSPHIGHO2_01_FULL_39_8]|uniref:Glycosyltransferase RgtA/B/C/D-like domain-containing protein n=1 Tax=Candidatus Roizmanbacteria bacterium RIFCSPHIGHO2_01_FULL_39_8 TaxID=1802033 RepID=A0A1F7GT10_9BACT|nr:MAG: hypothetical protein A2866_03470 [Candidatus Roizmanbacteria bacterium RIFCSPHIGHO2_01_FULL_39_8]